MTLKRILIIDDDEAIRKVFILALEGTGFQADTAPSGEKGIELVQQVKYDLIYLDLKMPKMDGVQTLRKIREMEKEIPVYIITAFYGEFLEELKKTEADGIDFELLKKPMGLDQIVSITRGILEGPISY